ncbi:unnamed protein product [Prunus armeniaca]
MLNPTKLSDGTVKLGTYNFDHDHARKALANMIILHEYPLSMVDHIGFKMYSNALQPLFKVCSRNTIKKDILKVFEVEREKTMKLLDTNRSRIAITTDMWTSNNQKRGFMTITSHFIDDAWNLQSQLIRYSVAFWLGTQKREEKFLEAARQLRVPTSKMLELDCKTSWNSTYSMLKTAMIYKDVFPRLKHHEPLYKEVPSESNWAKTKELVDKLVVYDWLSFEHEEVQAMALHMQTKFEKYWDTMHGLMRVASILDPRYNMKQIEFLCPPIYPNNASQEIKKYKDILYDLVKEYQSRSQQSQQVQSESLIPTSSSRPSMPKLDLVKQLDVFVSHSTTHGHVKSELDYYLEESRLPRNDDDDFDILCWWKSNGIKYPTLHDIARDILAIPGWGAGTGTGVGSGDRDVLPYLAPNRPVAIPICSIIMSSDEGNWSSSSRVLMYMWGDSKVHKKRFVANLHHITTKAQFQKWRTGFTSAILSNVHVRLAEPSINDMARVDLNNPNERMITFSPFYFSLGFMFPMWRFSKRVFDTLGCAPNQCTPNVYRTVICFDNLNRFFKLA